MKKIGIVGTGNMGRVIGLTLAHKGYEVFFGARDISKAKFASAFNNRTKFGTNQEAAAFGDIIYYSPRDVHPKDVINDLSILDGKIVIESGNWNISDELDAEKITISKTEILQQQLPNSKLVKAFNTILQEVFEHSIKDLKLYNIACFIASDFSDAKSEVFTLVKDLGFTPIDCGKTKQAILLEQIGSLMRILIRIRKNPWLSFSLTELPEIKDLRFGGRTASAIHGRTDFLKKN
jgi:predicted dinucleotide-binding enzyme